MYIRRYAARRRADRRGGAVPASARTHRLSWGTSAIWEFVRGESLERYIQRLEKLESLVTSFAGVKTAQAIQAGREVRVFVNAQRISDKKAIRLCHDIAKQIESELNALAAEFDADVDTDEAGALKFRFSNVRKIFVESELTRRSLKLEEREVGAIVYSSGDDTNEASAREMANFDRELAAAEMDLSRYLPSAGGVAFEDDYEVVALDD